LAFFTVDDDTVNALTEPAMRYRVVWVSAYYGLKIGRHRGGELHWKARLQLDGYDHGLRHGDHRDARGGRISIKSS